MTSLCTISVRETNTREYTVDADALRLEYLRDLTDDGVDVADDVAVVRACYDGGGLLDVATLVDESYDDDVVIAKAER